MTGGGEFAPEDDERALRMARGVSGVVRVKKMTGLRP
jgi:hypothetical protein